MRVAVVSSSANATQCCCAPRASSTASPWSSTGLVARQDGLAGKPAPDTYLDAAARFDLTAAECVVVEDATSGVEAGRNGAFGLVVGVDRGAGADALREHGADVVVRDLAELVDQLPPDLPETPTPPHGENRMNPITSDPLDRVRYPVDEWALVETEYAPDEQGVAETNFAVGNGTSACAATSTRPWRRAVRHVRQRLPRDLADPARRGRLRLREDRAETIINAPDAKVIRLYVDDEPLVLAEADILRHTAAPRVPRRVPLPRDRVVDAVRKRVLIRARRLVSFTDRHLAVIDYEVTVLDGDASILLSSQILNRQDVQDEYHAGMRAAANAFDPRKAEAFTERVLDTPSSSAAPVGVPCSGTRRRAPA